jgi:Na+-transporting NADH:ubiquinone oxidoreductase subunit NqrE
MHVPWTHRWLGAFIGAGIGIYPLTRNAIEALPNGIPPAIALGTYLGAVACAAVWIAGVVFALHREHDFLACLVTSFGIPGLIYTLFHGANTIG